MKSRGRKEPYTERGIRRVPCARCGKPSTEQWTICSLNGLWHGICPACDALLNQLLLRFMQHPDPDATLAAYCRKKGIPFPAPE